MKKIAFIIPYFGNFPNYFQLWLNSCKTNKNIDWIIFTNNTLENYILPNNVKYNYCDWINLVERFQKNFNFQINLKNYYYLCNFKVAYGEIFKRELANYDYWGYCDVDLVWGNLEKYLFPPCERDFDKVSWRGHMTLFKNSEYINSIYRKRHQSVIDYKVIASNKYNLNFHYDEREINLLFKAFNCSIFFDIPFAEMKIRQFNFKLLHRPIIENYKNNNQVFFWKNGSLYRIYTVDNSQDFMTEEFAYFHFLKREMSISGNINDNENILIVPNSIFPITNFPNLELINKYSKNKVYFKYYFNRLTIQFLIKKIIYSIRNMHFNFENKIYNQNNISFEFSNCNVDISEIKF
jgi:hypothetical protein